MAIDWDDKVLSPMMANGVFGESVSYLPLNSETAQSISGVFDEAYHVLKLSDDGVEINTIMPVFGVRSALFTVYPKQRDRLTRLKNSETYVVRDVQPDGLGHILLLLNKVRD